VIIPKNSSLCHFTSFLLFFQLRLQRDASGVLNGVANNSVASPALEENVTVPQTAAANSSQSNGSVDNIEKSAESTIATDEPEGSNTLTMFFFQNLKEFHYLICINFLQILKISPSDRRWVVCVCEKPPIENHYFRA
jgi:hypothetical protein